MFVNPKLIVLSVVYLTLIYSAVAAFTVPLEDFEVQTFMAKPDIVSVNSTEGDGIIQDNELADSLLGGGFIGLVVGVAIVVVAGIVTAPAGGVGAIPALGIVTAGASIGACAGGLAAGIEGDPPGSLTLSDALGCVPTFLGAIIGMFAFLMGFLFISPKIFGTLLPDWLYFFLYFMILPIWIYFAVALTELGVRALHAIRG